MGGPDELAEMIERHCPAMEGVEARSITKAEVTMCSHKKEDASAGSKAEVLITSTTKTMPIGSVDKTSAHHGDQGEEERALNVRVARAHVLDGKLALQDTQNPPDDSGVAFHTDHVTTVSSLTAMAGLEQGYKSPQLVAEEIGAVLSGDMYSIVHVRDAVESLDSEAERTVDNTSVSSETFAAISPLSTHGSQSSDAHHSRVIQAIEEATHDSDDGDDRGMIGDRYAATTKFAYEKMRDAKRRGIATESRGDKFSGKEATDDVSDNYSQHGCSDQESEAGSPPNVVATPPKRGKKRAQEDDNVPLLVRQAETDELSDEELFGDSGMQHVHQSRVRKLAPRLSPSTWLHPVFHVGEEDLTPRPLRHHIELLRHAIQEVPCDASIYKRMFSNIFGPVICCNRDLQIFETVNTVLAMFGNRFEEVRNASHQQYGESCARQIINEDHFIYRYLSSFETFKSFLENNDLLLSVCSSSIMREMHARMAEFWGATSETGYEYWAKARALHLHKRDDRPLHVGELNEAARKDWVEMLEHCSTIQETHEVSERFFGPLRQIQGFPTPYVEIQRYWNRCECGICQRNHKRARTEREEDSVVTVDESVIGTIV